MAASTPTPREEFVYMAKLAEMVEFMEKVSSSVESRGNEDHVVVIRDYRSKIDAELSNICDGILKLLDTRLVPSAASGNSKVFYLKMKETTTGTSLSSRPQGGR